MPTVEVVIDLVTISNFTLVTLPGKAEGKGPYAVRVNWVKSVFDAAMAYDVSTTPIIMVSLAAGYPARWGATPPRRTLGTVVALAVPMRVDEEELLWIRHREGTTNAAGLQIYLVEQEMSLLPRILACKTLDVYLTVGAVTEGQILLLVDYDVFEVTPEQWQALLPGG